MERAPAEVLIQSLLTLWPLWTLVLLVGAARLSFWLLEQRRLAGSGIAEIDTMSGSEFEQRLVLLFRARGFRTRHVGRRGDFGADLVIERDGRRIAVQAKRWTKNVGVKAVQEAHASCAMYDCASALVVTNRYYSEAARKLARANRVELWDRDRLVSELVATRFVATPETA